jgi:hypothetical protein
MTFGPPRKNSYTHFTSLSRLDKGMVNRLSKIYAGLSHQLNPVTGELGVHQSLALPLGITTSYYLKYLEKE